MKVIHVVNILPRVEAGILVHVEITFVPNPVRSFTRMATKAVCDENPLVPGLPTQARIVSPASSFSILSILCFPCQYFNLSASPLMFNMSYSACMTCWLCNPVSCEMKLLHAQSGSVIDSHPKSFKDFPRMVTKSYLAASNCDCAWRSCCPVAAVASNKAADNWSSRTLILVDVSYNNFLVAACAFARSTFVLIVEL